MTPQPPVWLVDEQPAPARVHVLEVGAELYLFANPLDLERYALRIRGQNPRRRGVLPIFGKAAADALIAKT